MQLRNTWRRDLDADAKQMGRGQLERLAQNRDTWRELVGGHMSQTGLQVKVR
jgi:hypothetical protein